MYKKASSELNFVPREKEVLAFWKENHIFQKSVRLRKGAKPYTFFDGPPTANGKPHIGHVLTRSIKDIIPRYKTMKGFDVLRKAGWDTHGLPVEIEVEKKLGFTEKSQIEEYGIEKFNALCRESAFSRIKDWEKMTERIAYWVDLSRSYVTYTNPYIESVWWLLSQIWDKGLLYQGYKVPPYYDSMIGKLIVYGRTREGCLMRLRRALEEYVIEGMKTTIPLHRRLIDDPEIQNGDYTIKWLEEWLQRNSEANKDG